MDFCSYLGEKKEFADVTLVSDDQVQTPAHKVVLSACSPVLRSLLTTNPHSHPLLYLRGVRQTELQAILQFIYFGETEIAANRFNDFISIATDLEIKEITGNDKNLETYKSLNKHDNIQNNVKEQKNPMGEITATNKDEELLQNLGKTDDIESNFQPEDGKESIGESLNEEFTADSTVNSEGIAFQPSKTHSMQIAKFKDFEIENTDSIIEEAQESIALQEDQEDSVKVSQEKQSETESFSISFAENNKRLKCLICNTTFSRRDHLNRHNKNKHKPVEFPCRRCRYTTLDREQLLEHLRSFTCLDKLGD